VTLTACDIVQCILIAHSIGTILPLFCSALLSRMSPELKFAIEEAPPLLVEVRSSTVLYSICLDFISEASDNGLSSSVV